MEEHLGVSLNNGTHFGFLTLQYSYSLERSKIVGIILVECGKTGALSAYGDYVLSGDTQQCP